MISPNEPRCSCNFTLPRSRRMRADACGRVRDDFRPPGSSMPVGKLKEATMGKTVAGITTSVDGYITGPDDGPGCGLGVGGERLHYWFP